MILLAVSLLAFSPQADTLTLDAAYREAIANWPSVVQAEMKRSISELNSDNLGSHYLPGVSLKGQAVYHSDVVKFPFDMPGFPAGIPNDQYDLALDVNQLIYDGGEISTRKRISAIEGNLGSIETEIELHQVRDRVNSLFFEALLLQSEIELTASLAEDLGSQLEVVRAGVSGGVVLRSDADILEAELIKVEQDLDASSIRRKGTLAALSRLMGRPFNETTVLVPPTHAALLVRTTGRRPEFGLFEQQIDRLKQIEALSSVATRPHLSGFGQAGVGRPPDLDLFSDEFGPYFVLGVRLNWKLWDWSQAGRQREIRQIERQIVSSEEETFARQLAVESELQLSAIERLDAMLARDDEVIVLRNRIAMDASRRLENGVITATDYLLERNQAHRAELRRAIHEIQLVAARVQYATTIGAYL